MPKHKSNHDSNEAASATASASASSAVLTNEEERRVSRKTPQESYNDIIKYANSQRKGVCGTGVVTKKLINPSSDFFNYVNRGWIRNKRLKSGQEYIMQIDNFRLAQDAVYNQLIDIVEDATTPATIKHLYKSLTTSLTSSQVHDHIRTYVAFLDECITENNIWKLLAYLNTNEMTRYACPISWDVSADEKNSKKFIHHISYPELSLYDYRYYLNMPPYSGHDDDRQRKMKTRRGRTATVKPKKRKQCRTRRVMPRPKPRAYDKLVLTKFVNYVNNIFRVLGYPTLSGLHVLQIERQIIRNMACYGTSSSSSSSSSSSKSLDDYETEYEKVSAAQLKKKTNLDWQETLKHMGCSSGESDVVCSSTGYILCMMKSLLYRKTHDTDADADTDTDTDTDSDSDTKAKPETMINKKRGWKSLKWRSYWVYIYARHIIQYHKEWSDIYYKFCMKFLRGQAAPLPQRITALYGTTYAYDTFFANAYKRKFFQAEQVKYVEEIAQDILKVANDMVRANSWVSKSTRAEAHRKLDTLKIVIGMPEKLGPDIPDSISHRFKTQDAWSNLMDIFNWRTRVLIRNNGRPEYDMPQIDWNQMKFVGSQAYVANAYYTETRNSVYIPLGYFQTGFVDLDHGPEYNLARIGYTLGHEIGHSLHVYGRMFDHTGNMRSWWTPRDSAIYNRKLANVERQYEAAARADGLEFDAKLSLSEDLADITGLKLCEMVLNERHERNNLLVPLRMVSFEKFYTEFANQNRQKIYRRSIFAQLKSNPHPLDKYRTNIPLSRMALFNKLYNIKPGDKMHWQTEDTVW